MKGTIKHLMAGMGCFAWVKLRKRTVVMYNTPTLFCQNFYGMQYIDRIFGEEELKVIGTDIQPYFVHISEGVHDFQVVLQSSLTVPVAPSPLR